ncbi:MAG: PHP domain-containing protein [Actinobacteria bacterium]|nr:PHP domain-containing protein [Actinomycetota bacterium]
MRCPGLRYEKLDLHVHTPASEDFDDKSVTGAQIVEAAIKSGLRGIAVTDHHSAGMVDEVQAAAAKTELAVFPGVEIPVIGGQNGIHVVGIFDVSKTAKDIENLLGAVGIPAAKYGKRDIIATDIADVISKIHQHGGLAILAHANSSKGVLAEIRGASRKTVFSNPNLYAVEVTDADFSEEKKASGKRAVDWLDGKHEEFSNKRLAVYEASDNPRLLANGEIAGHCLAGIGSRYTYFKVDSVVTLESLRQCFIDRDVRIRQHFEVADGGPGYPRLERLSVKGGFLDGMSVELHPGLNTILGAKGAGKSLLIEFLRFALNQEPSQKHIREDHDRKLEMKLERFGEAACDIVDEAGTRHSFTRKYDVVDDHPYADPQSPDPASVFPVLFLSQNEIVRIAESEDEQIRFIDSFFDFRYYQNRIRELEKRLQEIDGDFAVSLRAIREAQELDAQVANLRTTIDGLDARLKSDVFERFSEAQKKMQGLSSQAEFVESINQRLTRFCDELAELSPPGLDELVKDDPALKRAADISVRARDAATKGISETVTAFETLAQGSRDELARYRAQFDRDKQAYDKEIERLGGDFRGLSTQREKQVLEWQRLSKLAAEAHARASKVKKIREQRDEILGQLSTTYSEYTAERKRKCADFGDHSGGRVKAAVTESSNVDEFRTRLLGLKKGSYLRDDEIDRISQKISPSDFILNLLRYDAASVNKEQFLKAISNLVGIDLQRMKTLADFLLKTYQYEELLALQYQAMPKDRPEIMVNVGVGAEDRFELLRDVSTGQKCTAMLVMALCEGTMPVIVDQPEDSLDMRSIWEDMCSKLRIGKETRQFIFTTHNANLAVPSDTDQYIILEADAHRGQVVFSGAIDSPEIAEEAIKYLEGGVPTYGMKYQKYDMKRRLS